MEQIIFLIYPFSLQENYFQKKSLNEINNDNGQKRNSEYKISFIKFHYIILLVMNN